MKYADLDLDPGIRAYVAQMEQLEAAEMVALTPAASRLAYRQRCRPFESPRPPGVTAEDLSLGPADAPIRARVYRPTTASATPAPAVMFFHGGGWVVGDLDTHDGITADLAATTGATVVAVDYRSAPEHPFPAAFDDAYATTCAVRDGAQRLSIDPARIVVTGDSAGGNLAAAVALAARDRGGPRLCGQALLYPCLDPRLDTPACRENARAPLLTTAVMASYWRLYLGAATSTASPYAAPALAPDLRDLPPAFVSGAFHDPLRDDARAYAERLRAAGCRVAFREAARLVHGHLRARHLSADARAEFAAWAAAIREFFTTA